MNGTNLVNGNIGLSLRLFDASSGGTKLYEDSNTVAVADGSYSTYIGDNPTNDSFLAALTNAAVYVEAAVNGTTLLPRERLTSVGYSLATRGMLVTTNGTLLANPAENSVDSAADHSTIAGGQSNRIGLGTASFIGGGVGNTILTSAHSSFIGGGQYNRIEAPYSMIPGGHENVVGNFFAANSFAAGYRAHAMHKGSFVWADMNVENIFATTADNQFLIRAAGGVGIGTNSTPAAMLSVNGPVRINDSDILLRTDLDRNHGLGWYGSTKPWAGVNIDGPVLYGYDGGALGTVDPTNIALFWDWHGNVGIGTTTPTNRLQVAGTVQATAYITGSDRNAKENIAPVSAEEILAKVCALPLATWTFKNDSSGTHLGPMAQDFRAAFGLGNTDSGIFTVDADGVALAAIQALKKEADAKIEALERQNAEQTRLLLELRARLDAMTVPR